MDIILPLYGWFTAEFDKASGLGNCWSGSVGTDGHGGSLNRPLFEYTVIIKHDENKVKTFTASWWIRPAWPEELDPAKITTRDFEGTPESLDKILAWLTEACNKSGIR